MISLEMRALNACEAGEELLSFFYRHEQDYWPGVLGPVVELLQQGECQRALQLWRQVPLLNESGLMEVKVTYDAGFRVADMRAEQQHFDRLLQQVLTTMNNLRLHVDVGVHKPLVAVVCDAR